MKNNNRLGTIYGLYIIRQMKKRAKGYAAGNNTYRLIIYWIVLISHPHYYITIIFALSYDLVVDLSISRRSVAAIPASEKL
jgi:hypothetical protein